MTRRRVSREIKHMLEAMEEDIQQEDIVDENLPDDEIISLEEEIDDLEEEAGAGEEPDDELTSTDDADEDDADEKDIEAEDDMDDEWEDEGVTASEEAPGIEDEITDTGKGGDPTVKEIVDQGAGAAGEVQKDSEVFPTQSEYVASIVDRLDRVADVLEKSGNTKLAYRIDVVSENLEKSISKGGK